MSNQIPSCLQEATAEVSAILHWPNNLGIVLRRFTLRTTPETQVLAVFIHGLADDELVRLWALEPLERVALLQPGTGRLSPEMVHGLLPAPRIRLVNCLPDTIHGIVGGATALFLEGGQHAVLVETQRTSQSSNRSEPGKAPKETFGRELPENLALIRRRLPDPALVAEPRRLPKSRAAAVLVYVKGQAEPGLIEGIDKWLQEKGGEWALNRGEAGGGISGLLGMLPALLSIQSPDKAAALLDEGYVAVLVDGLPFAYVAPVTAPAMFFGSEDVHLRRPVAYALQALRAIAFALVLAAPAAVVSLMSYHQEMLPTPFLLAMARTRDNALLPVILEVLGLMGLQEAIREAAYRLSFPVGLGGIVIVGTLIVTLLVQIRLVGPLPATVTILVTLASFAFSSYDTLYLSRTWAFYTVVGAGIFGFYGLAAVAFILLVYLTQAKSFCVPFIGETGLRFRTPGHSSNRKGGNLRASR